MIGLTAILGDVGIDPAKTVVMRHRPFEPALHKVFPQIVAERRDLFEAYQSSHGERATSALQRADYLAAFIGQEAAKATFVGLYAVGESRPLDREEWNNLSVNQELMSLGMSSWSDKDRESGFWFDLRPLDSYAAWSGRLIVRWPAPDRSWYRWADRNTFEIFAVHEDDFFGQQIPAWDELVIPWPEMPVVHRRLREMLAQWRGIYLITDLSDGARYVGSAYGVENIWQRWQQYGRTGHGGNQLLKARDHRNFSFSILQRTSPDLPADEVIALESKWKIRLKLADLLA